MYITDDLPLIQRYAVIGSRRFSTIAWGITTLLGSICFLILGISSSGNYGFSFLSTPNITFFPQGLVMCFYGTLGFFFSCYLWLTVLWDVGGGFNEFNIKGGFVQIFRWGFPGKYRRINLVYEINLIQSIRVELKEGINPRHTIYMRILQLLSNPGDNGVPPYQRDIPLTGVSAPLTLEQVEKQAYEVARFLNVPLELF